MNLKRVGILRGGMGDDYTSSLRKGGDIISHIAENLGDKYKTFDILVDKEGIWHINGVKVLPADLVHKVDIVWNTAEPSFSLVLNNFSIPNVGVNAFSSALANSRDILREHIKKIGIQMPRFIVLPKSAKEVFEKFSSPWIVKNSNQVRIVKTFNELAEAINNQDDVIVEEFIAGNAGSAHSLNNFRGQNLYIIPPSNLTGKEKAKLTGLVKDLHQHLGATHYLKTDFILHPKRGVFLTGIDLSPDLRAGSHLEQALHSMGAKMHNIVEHMLEKAL